MYHTVAEYTHMSFAQLDLLPFDEFLLYYRNAIVNILLQSEDGRKELNEFRISQLDDDDALDELDKLLE